MDGIEKLKKNDFNQTVANHLNTYITFLNDSCKIPFHMYTEKESKTLKWRDLTEPEKLKLFKSIKIPELFPSLRNARKVQKLWDNFKELYKPYGQAKTWMNKKLKILQKKLQVG